ncbi:cytochrome P450 71A1-like [Olea europaea var. sylvestris]|uniref:cytochrome P450 71A1-like n=1 Tax=Olea europaea var. sylvestris TaxID=158386 RepID=UPI000C1CDC91|nr:cytochrome P450 71A1-like [Olea europaea var. sylvestris]
MKSCIIQRYEIQPRTLVYINAWGIARDPEYWENPMEFWPERFLNSAVDIKGQDFGLIPFGSGRRNCPGMSLGLVTVELALANLLYSFDWELPRRMKAEDIDSDVLPGITDVLFVIFFYQIILYLQHCSRTKCISQDPNYLALKKYSASM